MVNFSLWSPMRVISTTITTVLILWIKVHAPIVRLDKKKLSSPGLLPGCYWRLIVATDWWQMTNNPPTLGALFGGQQGQRGTRRKLKESNSECARGGTPRNLQHCKLHTSTKYTRAIITELLYVPGTSYNEEYTNIRKRVVCKMECSCHFVLLRCRRQPPCHACYHCQLLLILTSQIFVP